MGYGVTALEACKKMDLPRKSLSWNEALREAIKASLKQGRLSGTLASKRKHPEFIESIEALAQKSGLGYTPHILVVDELPVGPVWSRKLPNAGASPLQSVLVSKSMLESTGSSLNRPMSKKLETVMAHEFSHLKDGALHNLGVRVMPFALPLISMAGLWLYDRAKAKTKHIAHENKKEYGKRLTESIHKEADEQIEETKQGTNTKKWHADPNWSEWAINAGRYALVAAVGLATGLLLTRHFSLSAEFRADKFAVEKTGSPEMFKDMLKQLSKIWGEAKANQPKEDKVGGIIMEKYHWLISRTIHAHPSLQERLAHIDKISLGR